jgi:hypothetical protein
MIVLRVAGVVLAALLGVKLIQWRRTRPCWLYGHDRRWLAIRAAGVCKPGESGGMWPANHYVEEHKHVHGDTVYIGRWACRRCPKMGETCLGADQDWTIEHEALVPDTKKWANWSKPT